MNPVWQRSPPPWTLFTYSGHLGSRLALNTSEMVELNVFSDDPQVVFKPVQATEALSSRVLSPDDLRVAPFMSTLNV